MWVQNAEYKSFLWKKIGSRPRSRPVPWLTQDCAMAILMGDAFTDRIFYLSPQNIFRFQGNFLAFKTEKYERQYKLH